MSLALLLALWPALLPACGDPALDAHREAIKAYDAGRAALESDPAAAATRFAEAAARDPDAPELLAWQAEALSRAGDLAGAEQVLATGLVRFPDAADLAYNRAALLARLGRLDEAAALLGALYAAGAAEPAEAGEDPDFAALAADPRYASYAPPPQVEVHAVGEAGPVLLGEEWTLELEILARAGELLTFTELGEPTGLLRHQRTVEDLSPPEGRRQRRTLTVTWRAVAPGQRALGPWLVAAGGQSAVVGPLAVEVVALPGREPGEPDELGSLFSVEAALAGPPPPWAGRLLGRLAVRLPPDAAVEVEPQPPRPPVQLELRRGGQTEQIAWLYADAGPSRVRVTRGPTELLSAEVP